MKVVFHEDFYKVYTSDPAAEDGRIEAIMEVISGKVELVTAREALIEDIEAVHTPAHIERVKNEGLHEIASLAAGGAMQAAEIGLKEPCFGLIRPPGHHASSDSAWGFCFYSNMAVAIEYLKRKGAIKSAFVLDFDLHYGDGTVNILGKKGYVKIFNPKSSDRNSYLKEVAGELADVKTDIIGISAGFDNHEEDWGGVLSTDDYTRMGSLVRESAAKTGAGFFAILEGGYNHRVLGQNAWALIKGMEGKSDR
ncbi:MAG TPA: histone deacetylase family protein [Desulfomonilia bacterium]|nr:histone deacetylase family protein [Desulfomonilia bacterium]